MEEILDKKAELILGGDILVPRDFVFPFRLSRSTAGPGAGKTSIAIEFGGTRVKKSISFEKGDFELHCDKTGLSLTKNGLPFIDNVTIVPVIFHSPNHAFFNLDQRCMYRCVFCASPLIDVKATNNLTDDKIVEMIRNAEKDHDIPSVALTSGVIGSIQESTERMARCVERLRSEFPDRVIGVEPYVETKEQVDMLKAAGADEFKLNRETARMDIFKKVCPDLDYDNTLNMLAYAVKVFGKGRVSSNIIYGMGETDDDVTNAMDAIASIGCLPSLRALKITDSNSDAIQKVLGRLEPVSKERMMRLAKEQKRIMEKYGLNTKTFRTMCFECQCCDLVPFRDV